MNNEQIKKIIESPEEYDYTKEDTLWSMARDFYSRKMRSTAILVFVWCGTYATLAVFSAIQFFRADLTKFQIMYAAFFVCCIQLYAAAKVFSWQAVHRNSIKREIKRLELRIAALAKSLEEKADKG